MRSDDEELELDKKHLEPNARLTRLRKAMNRQMGLPGAVKELGYATVTQFIESQPGVNYFELAKEAKIVPSAIMDGHAIEAVEQNQTRRYAIEAFVRYMRDPEFGIGGKGWIHRKGEQFVLKTINAIANTKRGLINGSAKKEDIEALDRCWKALLDLDPPLGWLPNDIDDPLIHKAFAIGWPERSNG
jgi:hypothetical protein